MLPVVLHAQGVAETVADGHPLEVNLGLRRIFLVLGVYLRRTKCVVGLLANAFSLVKPNFE